jgi:Tol biopolymer transport system component
MRRLIQTCLQKDPKRRLQSISDYRLLLDEQPQADSPAHGSSLAWVIAAVFGLVALALAFVYFRRPSEPPRIMKLSVVTPEKAVFDTTSIPAVSPDGRRVVFAINVGGNTSLWMRDLDSLATRPLPGTEGGAYPFWSPDGRFLAFLASGKLKKIDVTGGPAITLCDAPFGRPGTWSQNDVILFGPSPGAAIYRVPASGGNATPVTVLDKTSEFTHKSPWFLPDGRHFLYTARSLDPDKTRIYVGDLESKSDLKDRHLVITAASNAVYASGYLLFVRDHTLMAQPFDTGALKLTGNAVPIAENVAFFPNAAQGQFSPSQNGVLVYESGSDVRGNVQLTWVDRKGNQLGVVATALDSSWGAISSDGKMVAYDRRDPRTVD